MALQKEKTLTTGEVGNYWRVSHLTFTREGMMVDVVLSLYKDATLAAAGSTPMGASYRFRFPITQLEIASGNIVGIAYVKIKAMIDDLVTPINGIGDPVSKYPDLVGYTDV